MTIPTRCCGNCVHWTRGNPDDLTAPEGKCGLPKDPGVYPFYWPNTLQRDCCGTFTSQEMWDCAEAKIAEEEAREEHLANGQFGVGA